MDGHISFDMMTMMSLGFNGFLGLDHYDDDDGMFVLSNIMYRNARISTTTFLAAK